MGCGDTTSKVIKAVTGKDSEGCGPCKAKRNEMNRRGWIKGSLLGLFLLKNAAVTAAWGAVGAKVELDLGDVLGFIRTANVATHTNYGKSGSYFTSREDMLSGVEMHRAHFTPEKPGHIWMDQFSPTASQPLPNWSFDAYGEKDRYVMVVTGKDYTFTTDEVGVIYRAPTQLSAPKASELKSAAEFPGAVSIGNLKGAGVVGETRSKNALEKFFDFFTPTVYAYDCCTTPSCLCSYTNCYSCGFCDCMKLCSECQLQRCSATPLRSGVCLANLGLGTCIGTNGVKYTCTWYYGFCGGTTCSSCATALFRTCCQPQQHCTTCP